MVSQDGLSSPQCLVLPVITRKTSGQMRSRNPRALRSERKWAGLGEDLRQQVTHRTAVSTAPHLHFFSWDLMSDNRFTQGALHGQMHEKPETWFPPSKSGKGKAQLRDGEGGCPSPHHSMHMGQKQGTTAEPQTTDTAALSQKCCDRLWSDHLGWLFSLFTL